MAAPLKRWLLLRSPAILARFATTTEILGQRTKYRLKVDQLVSSRPQKQGFSRFIPLAGTLLFRSFQPKSPNSQNGEVSSRRQCSQTPDEDDSESTGRRPLKLMDFNELIWPHPLKSIRNAFFSFLIKGYFDEYFSNKNFMDGSEQVRTEAEVSEE